jgi:hypothetical protein
VCWLLSELIKSFQSFIAETHSFQQQFSSHAFAHKKTSSLLCSVVVFVVMLDGDDDEEKE